MEASEMSKLQAQLDSKDVELQDANKRIEELSQTVSTLVFKVQRMRTKQKEYFKSKNPVDMKASKGFEQDVDSYTNMLRSRGFTFKDETPDQPKMF